jgi:hydroxyacylglutathione hydrolase
VRHHRAVTVLDVRRTDEFGASRIQGAVNIPVQCRAEHRAACVPGEVTAGQGNVIALS